MLYASELIFFVLIRHGQVSVPALAQVTYGSQSPQSCTSSFMGHLPPRAPLQLCFQ